MDKSAHNPPPARELTRPAGAMTAREVAARTGLSAGRIHALTRSGQLASIRGRRPMPHGGFRSTRLYLPGAVEAFALLPRGHGPGVGGAPKGNLNAMTTAKWSRRLHPLMRRLPPRSRAIVAAALSAAIPPAADATSHRQRHRRRLLAVGRIMEATARAWLAPAPTRAERHRNLVVALRPWLELIPA